MIISKIQASESNEFVKLVSQLDNETKFMLFESGERQITVKDIETRCSYDESNGIFIGVEEENKLLGFISASRGMGTRSEHTAYIAIGIIQKYVNKGIGKLLFEEVEKWALKYTVNRLDLTVLTQNEIAINLYEKIGFKSKYLEMRFIKQK